MTPEGPAIHVGEPVDAAWGTLPDRTRTIRTLAEWEDDGETQPSVAVVRLKGDTESTKRTERIRSDGHRSDTDRATSLVEVEAVRER